MHHRHRHAVSYGFVSMPVRCWLAIERHQRPVVGETLQAFALSWRQAAHCHVRRHYAFMPAAVSSALQRSCELSMRRQLLRPAYGDGVDICARQSVCRAALIKSASLLTGAVASPDHVALDGDCQLPATVRMAFVMPHRSKGWRETVRSVFDLSAEAIERDEVGGILVIPRLDGAGGTILLVFTERLHVRYAPTSGVPRPGSVLAGVEPFTAQGVRDFGDQSSRCCKFAASASS